MSPDPSQESQNADAPVVECVWSVAAELGEGPLWSDTEQAVWFVDIKGRAIHRYHEPSGEMRTWKTPADPSFIAPTAAGDFVCGLKSDLSRFEPVSGVFTPLCTVEPAAPDNRLNDGFVDHGGRLWFGSLDDNEKARTGALYQLTSQGCVCRDSGYVISNGSVTSPDGRTLYHTDTLGKVIYAFACAADGMLSEKHVFARIERDDAYPDGMAVDAEGCVWVALFGGWGLNRYSPDGQYLETLRPPCANVTKPAFGGSDRGTLYITTAWKGLDETQRAEQELAGGLFRARVAVPGLAQERVAHGL